MESGESYLACVKKQKSEKLLSSEQCTWCLSTVENFWYKTVWKEFAANQHFQLLCIGQRQSSGALTSGKPGWNFISDILENPSLVILILIYTVTTRWLGLKTEKSYSLATQVFIENKILFFSEILCGSWWQHQLCEDGCINCCMISVFHGVMLWFNLLVSYRLLWSGCWWNPPS